MNANGTIASIGDELVRKGVLAGPSLERARRLQRETGEKLDSVLAKLGLVSEQALAQAYAAQCGVGVIAAAEFPCEPLLADRVNPSFLRQFRVLPVALTERELVLAMADPTEDFAAEAIAYLARRTVLRRVGLATDIDRAVDALYGEKDDESIRTAPPEAGGGHVEDVDRLRDLASEAPVIRLVNRWIAAAVDANASDIHVEPAADKVDVRRRLDGLLHDTDTAPIGLHAAIVSRIKIMAKLNIAERRLPQDGRFGLAVRGRDIDIRVSIVPTVRGESVVLRILDRSSVELSFDALGIEGVVLDRYLAALERPHGILLVTGPTGSGKTTTLYTSLIKVRKPESKILTVEDPVEYLLPGTTQTQAHPQIGLTFASVLRSFLRHDPDIIMIGEVRDLDTARIAIQAALTGHLVLSTLHTNDAVSAVSRLVDMGVEDYLLSATINGIAAQRLVRKLCLGCRQPIDLTKAMAERLQLSSLSPGKASRVYRATGCPACNGTGYRGRSAIVEVTLMSDGIRELVARRASHADLMAMARAEGMEIMHQHGMRKCLAGVTTVEEVLRATVSG